MNIMGWTLSLWRSDQHRLHLNKLSGDEENVKSLSATRSCFIVDIGVP